MDFSQISIVAILLATLSRFLLGGLWYSNVLFGRAWMAQVGMTEDKLQSANMARTFALAFVASLVASVMLALFLGSGSTVFTGMLYSFFVGFGWVAMSLATNDLFEQRSFKLFMINASYHVVSFTVMGAIIGLSNSVG